MMTRRKIEILGAALWFSVGTARMSFAQEQGTGPAGSETTPAKHNPSSSADVPPEGNLVSKTSQGMRMGLVGTFVGDQREIWTSPARLRLSDTEWLFPLSGITARRLVTARDFIPQLARTADTLRRCTYRAN